MWGFLWAFFLALNCSFWSSWTPTGPILIYIFRILAVFFRIRAWINGFSCSADVEAAVILRKNLRLILQKWLSAVSQMAAKLNQQSLSGSADCESEVSSTALIQIRQRWFKSLLFKVCQYGLKRHSLKKIVFMNLKTDEKRDDFHLTWKSSQIRSNRLYSFTMIGQYVRCKCTSTQWSVTRDCLWKKCCSSSWTSESLSACSSLFSWLEWKR
jgi:hypothetical protein